MEPQRAKGDEQDNKRLFRWGVVAVIVLMLLAAGSYGLLSARRAATPTMKPAEPPAAHQPAKPPGM